MKGYKKILLHSKFNPSREAERWVDGLSFNADYTKKVVVVGVGAGHHILKFIARYPHLPVVVWDFNPEYVKWVKDQYLLSDVPYHIPINVSDSLLEISKRFTPLLEEEGTEVLIHSPSLCIIPEHLNSLKDNLENYVLFLKTIRHQSLSLLENFHKNIRLKDKGFYPYLGDFQDKSLILVSAGPSLAKQLPQLAKLQQQDNLVIAAVGTALKPLLGHNILPDLVMVSDPQSNIAEQFPPDKRLEHIPLFYLSTANHEAIKNYQGDRFIIWQRGYEASEEQAGIRGEPLVRTGGSVATSLLDLIVKMGAKRVALIGQDLAVTGGKSHVEGTHQYKKMNTSDMRLVEDFYKTSLVPTLNNLSIYLKWFEAYRRSTPEKIELWNCTEGGAHINGWKHSSLSDYLHIN
ncbi:DUF115 domain-containing protein [Halobacillus litoralis]|uniref:motility associated factor glycosyltransferase family protein n=1 Tax=Halobacillus litoralis TaxID=45668 RepID=UPI001CD4850C|nr:6-hydroxymethylpterin diphosphokinase MptE-like protein [Halobacillus litoralis]MCA0971575.1 DUF115 domain-containing protein [Halobacillus litoralis]